MPVRDPPEDAPDEVVELLEAIDEEFDHENHLFFAAPGIGNFGPPTSILMYYPNRRERPDLAPETSTTLATITGIVQDLHPSTYSHVAGMENHDYPEDVPEGATELSKIHPKAV
jgi:hypothetical protein